MKILLVLSLLTLGLITVGYAMSTRASNAESAPVICAEGACLNPEQCGGQDTVCPAGPECFTPELCADEERVCPR